MNDLSLRLNTKINKVSRTQRRGLKATKANKFSGIAYIETFPDASETTTALALDTNTLKLFVNGGDRWYGIDRFEGTVGEIDGKHLIFVNRGILFYSLYYYNEKNDKIHLPEFMEQVFTNDIILDKLSGYNLYACYIEVVE